MEQKNIATEKPSREVIQLFDTIHSLCGESSPILTKIESEKEKASNTKKKRETELTSAEEAVSSYKEKLEKLNAQIKKFTADFEVYDKADYQVLFAELGMNFDPAALVQRVINESPDKVRRIEDTIKRNEDECVRLKGEISDLTTSIEELENKYSQAINDQNELKQLLEEVKAGNENITKQRLKDIGKSLELSSSQINLLGQRLLFSDDLNIYYALKEGSQKKSAETKISQKEDEKVEVSAVEDVGFEEEKDEEKSVDIKTLLSESRTDDKDLEDSRIKPTATAVEVEETVPLDAEEELDEIGVLDDLFDNTTDKEPDKEETVSLSDDLAVDEEVDFFKEINLDPSKYTEEELSILRQADPKVISSNIDKAESIGVDITSNVQALVDTEFVDKVEKLESLVESGIDIRLNMEVVHKNTLADLNRKLSALEQIGFSMDNVQLVMLTSSTVDDFIQNVKKLQEKNIHLDEKELNNSALYTESAVFTNNLDLIDNYDVSLKKHSGKLALPILAQTGMELALKADALIEAGEADVLKYNPELLSKDVVGVLGRIGYLKLNAMNYRNVDGTYKRLIEDNYNFRKEMGGKVSTNVVVSSKENNDVLASIIGDTQILDSLSAYNNSGTIDNSELSDDEFLAFTAISQIVSNVAEETSLAYTIGGVIFSRNKFTRNLMHLVKQNLGADNTALALAALAYDSYKTEDELKVVAKALDFNLAMKGAK